MEIHLAYCQSVTQSLPHLLFHRGGDAIWCLPSPEESLPSFIPKHLARMIKMPLSVQEPGPYNAQSIHISSPLAGVYGIQLQGSLRSPVKSLSSARTHRILAGNACRRWLIQLSWYRSPIQASQVGATPELSHQGFPMGGAAPQGSTSQHQTRAYIPHLWCLDKDFPCVRLI